MAIRSAIRLLTAGAALLLCGCAPSPGYRSEFLAMGTLVRVEIASGNAEQAATAANEVEVLVKRFGHEWYGWTADHSGELTQLNAALKSRQTAPVSPELVDLLQRAHFFFVTSEGYFDPAVGELVELWGFSGSERAERPLPTAAQLAAWQKQRPTFADLQIARGRASSTAPLQVDLGAIAKGRIIDLAIDTLRRRGVRNALVDAGGNIRVIGQNDGRPWRVAIRDPRSETPLGWLELRDGESISTSGDYEHYAMVDGRRIHHLFDPHTGYPVAHTMAVTVLAADATTADAASTALMAAGPDKWRSIARRLQLREALRVDGAGHLEMSSALHSRVHFSATVPQQAFSIIEW